MPDVYKRQAIGVTTSGITNGGSITVGGITVLSNANMISDAVISSNAIGTMHSGGNVMSGRIGVVPALKDDEVSVSYTHLDVYKRQG